MEPKKHKSEIKIVVYFHQKKDGAAYTQEEREKHYNRKEDYKFTYFPKLGGGYLTNHEAAFDKAEAEIKALINAKMIYKAMIFLCRTDESQEEKRVVNWTEKSGWEFYQRPSFKTFSSGHRYIDRYVEFPLYKPKQNAA